MLRLARSLASSAGASGRGAPRIGTRSLPSGPPGGVTPGSPELLWEAGHHEGGANDTTAAAKGDQIAKLREVATHVEVDISGDCGSMYRVMVVSRSSKGGVKQHRLVQRPLQARLPTCTA